VLCLASLITTVPAAKVMGYDCGTAAGLLAGAFTESTVIGTAGNTIARLALPEAEKARLLNNIPVAYAVSYLVGTSFVVWFLSHLAPRLLKVDLELESRKLEAEAASASTSESGTRSAYHEWDQRAYRIPDAFAGRSVADVEQSLAPARVFLQRIRRGAALLEAAPGTILERGDTAVVAARRQLLLGASTAFGEEVEGRGLLDFPMAALDVVVTKRELAERSLYDIAQEHGRGVILLKLVRAGEEIPFAPGTVVNRGDLLRLAGAESDVERAGKALGYVERPSSATDVVFVGLGVGLGAGPSFVAGLKETGPSLLVVGLIVAVVPHATAVFFGRYVLKMNPLLLLGACAGAGTATAALRAVQDEAGSKLPVLGYTVPYAIGNILLTAWGPVIVMLTR
jgi:putative transport protein